MYGGTSEQFEPAELVRNTEEENLDDSHLNLIFNNKASLTNPTLVKGVVKCIQAMENIVKHTAQAAAVKVLSVKLATLDARLRNEKRPLPGVEWLNDILSTIFAMWRNVMSVLP